ncbi:AraC-like ligand-binding domain-containing protein [Streptomyces triticiradicis]|uniref:Helix-turn-helix domain-containing protein n=1 Tax=Streptomyces triticiradicis TaxID=2651189 RepID=A0A7J5D1F1_9ACTN|nr:helix-turn-helix domain-containing protein [Streptomyces triticiradicis]KAB1976730.1 helix-turn-helix domain-containing protein [Streptomyces triticiradicis]
MWQGGSTASVPAADSFDWFADMVSSALMPTAFSTGDATGFYAEGSMLDLETAQVSRFSYSPLRSRRTPALIRRGDPEQYQLGLVTKGSAWLAQHGRESELHVGDIVLWDTSRPSESGSGTDGQNVELFVLQIPKAHMLLPSQQADRLLAQRFPAGTGMGAILTQFLLALADNGPDCRPQDLGGLGNMAVELATSCLTQQLGATREVPAQVRAHALLRHINAFIEHNLADPDLTPQVIADRHHISLRSLYVLFQGQHESVAGSIRRRRLEHCRADLACPDLRQQPIQTIAARWGFTSATAFSRAFRAAYDTTPNDYRADVLRSRISTDHETCGSNRFHRRGDLSVVRA